VAKSGNIAPSTIRGSGEAWFDICQLATAAWPK
jgi:hypothetical protein